MPRPRRSSFVLLVFSLLALGYSGCSDGGPVDPTLAPPPPSRAISDALHSGGNEHFFWLPPMVGAPGSFNGAFDPTKSPVVRICDNLAPCDTNPVARFSMTTGPGSETVRVSEADEHYLVNWHTDEFDVGLETTYRIEAMVFDEVLGIADVQFATSGAEAKNLTTGEIIGLKDGRTLPIKFRIEEGAIFVVTPEEGGTVEALQGTVRLEVPPGALTEETQLTVEPVDAEGSTLKAVQFGPAGLTFAEPVPVTIGYDPAALPPGLAETDLALNLLDGQGRWIVLPGSVVDPVTHTVTAPFHHFSTGGAGPAELAVFCPDGDPDTFELMEDAVDAVMEGGTIEVCDGTHTVSDVTVDKAVTFEGAAGTLPTITTGGERFGITFTFASGTTTIRNLRFETLWNLGFDHFVGSALLIGGPGVLPYDQVVIEDVELHVAIGSSGENAGSGAWIFGSDVAGAHVTVQNVTGSGGGAGLNVLTLTEALQGASVHVQNSSFSSRRGIAVASLSENSASGAISDVDIDNVDVTANLGVFVSGGNGGVGGRVDVTNSSFSGGALWYQSGGTGLIQNNTIECAHGSACIRVRSDANSTQVEPVRIIGNQLFGGTRDALWLTQLDAGPFEVRGNQLNGGLAEGDRTDPFSYSFHGTGIRVQNTEAAGIVTGNLITGAYRAISVDGGTAGVSAQDNAFSTVWSGFSVVNGGALSVDSSDLTDYQVPIGTDDAFATGDLTCNWWGDANGPQDVDPSIPAGVYTPWATGPVANGAGGACDGGA